MPDLTRIKRVYQLVDNRAQITFGSLMTGWNDVNITRDLEQLINGAKDPNNPNRIQQYPDDFDLYEVGLQNENDGSIKGYDQGPLHIRRLSTLLYQPQ